MKAYVLLDESGDLGEYGTRYFILAGILTLHPRAVERVIKKTRQRILKKKLKEVPELKANKSNHIIREYLLKHLIKTPCDILAIAVDKSKIRKDLYQVQNRLYNFLVSILLNSIPREIGEVCIIVDRRYTNTYLRMNFTQYIVYKLQQRRPSLRVEVHHIPSSSFVPLQAVDFVAWAIQRKYNFGDESYFNIIKDKIINVDNMDIWKK